VPLVLLIVRLTSSVLISVSTVFAVGSCIVTAVVNVDTISVIVIVIAISIASAMCLVVSADNVAMDVSSAASIVDIAGVLFH
jgi:hypothetical protein